MTPISSLSATHRRNSSSSAVTELPKKGLPSDDRMCITCIPWFINGIQMDLTPHSHHSQVVRFTITRFSFRICLPPGKDLIPIILGTPMSPEQLSYSIRLSWNVSPSSHWVTGRGPGVGKTRSKQFFPQRPHGNPTFVAGWNCTRWVFVIQVLLGQFLR